ncbi:MAG: CPBP family intramembrane metalloprotease [Treponema sp.]|jgi:membrane protease YdiL (CAAX protease family)|nr:CPBP family intramembrane metalloprotease [Treponema sp.]
MADSRFLRNGKAKAAGVVGDVFMKNVINWRLFFILAVVITRVIIFFTVAQNLVLFAVVLFLGLFFSKRIGLGLSILQGFLEGKNRTKELKAILLSSIGLGVLAGILIAILSVPFNKLIPELQNQDAIVSAAWKGFLASFYGGITEEVLLRLFLVFLFAWIVYKIKKIKSDQSINFVRWLSIILSAVVFGLGHLPASAVVIIRAIVLNGAGGIIFGWLYWQKGLELAIISHLSADIV